MKDETQGDQQQWDGQTELEQRGKTAGMDETQWDQQQWDGLEQRGKTAGMDKAELEDETELEQGDG